jgi:hypothetical protein
VSFCEEEIVPGSTVFIQSAEAGNHTVPGLDELSWPNLSRSEQEEAKALLWKYSVVFSQNDGDLGCTNLIEHEIPLLDDTPIRPPYRQLPHPSMILLKLIFKSRWSRDWCG